LLGSDTATGSTSETIVKVLAYCAWILPLLLLVVSIVTFFIQYNKYERKKQLEQKKI
jgi:cytochrome c-type biogenesis protein CcmH/NrfF